MLQNVILYFKRYEGESLIGSQPLKDDPRWWGHNILNKTTSQIYKYKYTAN